jgi:hypoxanthine phosphoribosyltransferase
MALKSEVLGVLGSEVVSTADLETIMDIVAYSSLRHYVDRVEEEPVVISTLNGAVPFTTGLMQRWTDAGLDPPVVYLSASSYLGTESVGGVRLGELDESRIEGRHVFLVEDIVDTGHTLNQMRLRLQKAGAKTVTAAALLDKPSRREVSASADFVGREIPDLFVVGFGLDYNQRYRMLRSVREFIPSSSDSR